MIFNSVIFLLFFCIVFFCYWKFCSHNFKLQNTILLLAGLVFYGYWSILFLGLLLLTTSIDFVFSHLIYKTKSKLHKKILLAIPLISNLGVLFIFKYYNFFSAEFCNMFGIAHTNFAIKLILPIGISFYTFQALAYVISVYKQHIAPEKNVITYLTFITFFPQLMAGPIEKPLTMLKQFNTQRLLNYNNAIKGLELLLLGYIKKTVLADNLAIIADTGFNTIDSYSGINMFVAILAFTFQIYFDFSGYSNIARGLAKLLGIELMQNFNNPYFSLHINDFWKRWHISLSAWFKEYVYFNLGGNKKGKFREYVNLFVTFAVSGLWHGANFTFIVWGMYHGVLAIIQKLVNKTFIPNRFINYTFTFVLVMIGWVFFRAKSIAEAIMVLKQTANFNTNFTIITFTSLKLIVLLFTLVSVLIFEYMQEFKPQFNLVILKNKYLKYVAYYSCILIILLFGAYSNNPSFIYFNF